MHGSNVNTNKWWFIIFNPNCPYLTQTWVETQHFLECALASSTSHIFFRKKSEHGVYPD